ncbi:LuxR C-terminal-related transcriptional regulator [Flavobacterium urocaniciphilum]|uniref:DNA-binding response regulator, NarL/FixJ family, contains REC and HTH domains n=1 Tax=Flavobacterium urocaniciphilum TaxID=1299341 RepID=A0A1H9E4Q8_9FLAO|nr:response regulator transcription factor [Flavobacterium urocaniciphilum]SEQ19888.1 DNA-binding response regulator, NarL/FixJ family, contains REC and HTH domains [Flavobacterium urocaniciphilum]
MTVNILLVDDHPAILNGYVSVLGFNDRDIEINPTYCHNSEDAYKLITNSEQINHFDFIFLDRSLPPFPEQKIKFGEDLALLAKEYQPKAKILMLTAHAESFIIYDILHLAKPNALIIKSDATGEVLLDAFHDVIDGKTYLSATVTESMKDLLEREDYLDSINRQIIVLLAQGFKNKTIATQLGLSDSTVEKRKSKIKDFFLINKSSDEDLINEAKKLGFI